MNNSKSIDEKIQNLKLSLEEVEGSLNSYLLEVPNIPYDNCPIGDNENDNRLIERFGDINSSNSQEHSDILAQLNMLSFEDAVKITQSRFVVLKGKIASLHRALVNFMLNIQSGNGYTEYNVPYICNANSLTGTGQLPKFEEWKLFSRDSKDPLERRLKRLSGFLQKFTSVGGQTGLGYQISSEARREIKAQSRTIEKYLESIEKKAYNLAKDFETKHNTKTTCTEI